MFTTLNAFTDRSKNENRIIYTNMRPFIFTQNYLYHFTSEKCNNFVIFKIDKKIS